MRGAAAARSFSRSMPRVARPRRLSVGSPLTRNRQPVAACSRRFAPSLPRSSPTTNSRPTRVSPSRRSRSSGRDLRGQNALRVARAAAVQRSPSTRLGKNGGTQSKCVDSTTTGSAGRPASRDDVEPRAVDGLLGDGEPALAQTAREPAARLAFAPGRRIDVAVRPARRHVYRIHASSSVRVSVRESRYFTITGVASDSPHSGPLPAVTARAPGTTTAPSGTTSGRSAVGLMTSPLHEVVDGRRSGQHGARARSPRAP